MIVALFFGYLYLLGWLGNEVVDLGREIERPEPFMKRRSQRRNRKRSSLSSLPTISIYPVFPLPRNGILSEIKYSKIEKRATSELCGVHSLNFHGHEFRICALSLDSASFPRHFWLTRRIRRL